MVKQVKPTLEVPGPGSYKQRSDFDADFIEFNVIDPTRTSELRVDTTARSSSKLSKQKGP